MSGHVHDFETQWVCEGCGARESLPAGTVVLSASEVAMMQELILDAWQVIALAKKMDTEKARSMLALLAGAR